ncbi:MAG: hypothetical protein EKK55_12415 [Rhodocyclaceae bacterium]|nr:MAG: hypothetical protein EKK55_12415 [Rhodocyclaceae bacterium]
MDISEAAMGRIEDAVIKDGGQWDLHFIEATGEPRGVSVTGNPRLGIASHDDTLGTVSNGRYGRKAAAALKRARAAWERETKAASKAAADVSADVAPRVRRRAK